MPTVDIIEGDCHTWLKALTQFGPSGAMKFDAIITDPPYGIGIAQWDGAMPRHWFTMALELLKPTGCAYIFGDPLELSRFQVQIEEDNEIEFTHRCTWIYEDGPNNQSMWQNKHQDCLVYAGPEHKQRTPQEPSKSRDPRWGNSRTMSDVWSFPRVKMNNAQREDHPTPKPIALMKAIIAASTQPGDLILDPFAGSGTTLAAAYELDRNSLGIEINPVYCKIARDRCEAIAKQGKLFEDLPTT